MELKLLQLAASNAKNYLKMRKLLMKTKRPRKKFQFCWIWNVHRIWITMMSKSQKFILIVIRNH